jgi:hypothetical protein
MPATRTSSARRSTAHAESELPGARRATFRLDFRAGWFGLRREPGRRCSAVPNREQRQLSAPAQLPCHRHDSADRGMSGRVEVGRQGLWNSVGYMDNDWVRAKLEEFLATCEEYRRLEGRIPPGSYWDENLMRPIANTVEQQVPTVRRILEVLVRRGISN